MLDSSTPGGVPAISYAAFGDDGFTHIFLRDTDGTTTQLTHDAANDETAEWSADGSRLVFQRGDDASGLAIYTMRADGSELTRLSPTPGRDLLPAFSPDGTQVVATTVIDPEGCNDGTMPLTSVVLMNADGTGRTTLVDGTTAPTCFNVQPRFSPDGSKISRMCAPFQGGAQVCTTDADGGNNAFLTQTSGTVAGDPHWSWDSTHLAISRRDLDGNVNVWTMRADGSELAQVTTVVDPEEAGDAGWSLDDTQLIYEQDTGGGGQSDPDAPAHIAVSPVGGGAATSLEIACSDKGCAPRFRPTP